MRQVGIIAAGALYAVEHNIERLAEDHQNARLLAERVASLPGVSVDMDVVQTNIVIMEVKGAKYTAPQIVEALKEQGILILAIGPDKLRAVTHLDVSTEDIQRAVDAFKKIIKN